MCPRSKAGTLYFIGTVQFLILMIVAETQYPGYSPADNYISDLGLWQYDSAYIFNPSVFVFGLLGAIGSYMLLRCTDWKWLSVLLIISSFGAMGVGVFNEDVEGFHFIVSAMAFGFGALAAISSYWYLPSRIGVIGVVLGTVAMMATCLYGTDTFLGLGHGGMERMILYPILGWLLLFNGHLIGAEELANEK
ncbi:MAG: DUF998 domain-containing protein [Methanomassiliicoccales archaeon]|jgi:hypothetical membrane protein